MAQHVSQGTDKGRSPIFSRKAMRTRIIRNFERDLNWIRDAECVRCGGTGRVDLRGEVNVPAAARTDYAAANDVLCCAPGGVMIIWGIFPILDKAYGSSEPPLLEQIGFRG